jgi:hypothetical protein
MKLLKPMVRLKDKISTRKKNFFVEHIHFSFSLNCKILNNKMYKNNNIIIFIALCRGIVSLCNVTDDLGCCKNFLAILIIFY